MNPLKILLSVLVLLCAAGEILHAQALKAGPKTLRAPGFAARKATETARKITEGIALQRPLLRQPVLTNLEPNIRRFIFTVTPRGAVSGPQGSGFVFASQHQGKTVLWGASAAQTVKDMGRDITITFHLDGAPVSFPATVELAGREPGLNAALIKLPQEAAQVALPFMLAPEAVSADETLFTYGFSEGNYKKTVRSVLVPGTERLVATHPRFSAPKAGFNGSVVLNEQGQAVGIELGGYELKSAQWPAQIDSYKPYKPLQKVSRVSEIVPARQLNALLREYHTTQAGSRVILLDGIKAGKLGVDEYIDRLVVHYQDGTHKVLERSPLWNLQLMADAVPEIENAQNVEIIISKNNGTRFVYQVDLTTRRAARANL